MIIIIISILLYFEHPIHYINTFFLFNCVYINDSYANYKLITCIYIENQCKNLFCFIFTFITRIHKCMLTSVTFIVIPSSSSSSVIVDRRFSNLFRCSSLLSFFPCLRFLKRLKRNKMKSKTKNK